MNFVDTHTHLYLKQFDRDRNDVIQGAIDDGVEIMLLPNIDQNTTEAMLKTCSSFPKNCFPMMGLHPCSVTNKNIESELSHVELELEKKKYIAVGEIGIDLYWEKKYLDAQKEAFSHQIKLAKKYNLPIVIHVRNSFNEAIEIVEKLNDDRLRGVFHCFSGDQHDAKRVINLSNFYLGIGGVLTFKNSNLDKAIESVDLKHLILETDAPYLAPEPFRGKRNESKFIVDIAKKLSKIHEEKIEDIATITTKNANALFNLKH